MKDGLWEKSWNSGHHYAQFKRQLPMVLEPSLGTGDAGRHQEEEDTDLFPEELVKKGNTDHTNKYWPPGRWL